MKRKKVLIVNNCYFPDMIGGTEVSLKILTESITKDAKNIKIAVFTATINPDEAPGWHKINNVPVYRYYQPLQEWKIDKRYNYFNSRALVYFIKVLNEYKPDIVHTNNISLFSPLVWVISKIFRCKVVHTVRDSWIYDGGYIFGYKGKKGDEDYLYAKTITKYLRYMSGLVDIVTTPSVFTMNQVISRGYFKGAKHKVIPNCISFTQKAVFEQIHCRKNNTSKKVSFFYAGRLCINKGIHILLNAFAELDNPNISLHICGAGEIQRVIERRCQTDKRICYLGKLNHQEVMKAMEVCDVAIIPSICDESFGRILIEAASKGMPVLASTSGAIPEIIENLKNGVLFEKKNKQDLIDKMRFMTNRQNLLQYYDHVLEGLKLYSIESQVLNYCDVYQ